MRGLASGHRAPAVAGARGGLLPPHPLAPPWPPRWRRRMRGPASGCPPPPPRALVEVIAGLLPPHSLAFGPPPPGSPRLVRLGAWYFAGVGTSAPRAGQGRAPRTLGGAVHRRVAGGSEAGRAWDVGRARPSHEGSAAAPARRASGTST